MKELNIDALETTFVGILTQDGGKSILVRQWDDTLIPVSLSPNKDVPTLWVGRVAGTVNECLKKISALSGPCHLEKAFVFSSMKEMLEWAAE